MDMPPDERVYLYPKPRPACPAESVSQRVVSVWRLARGVFSKAGSTRFLLQLELKQRTQSPSRRSCGASLACWLQYGDAVSVKIHPEVRPCVRRHTRSVYSASRPSPTRMQGRF